jgi:hypothetical protein
MHLLKAEGKNGIISPRTAIELEGACGSTSWAPLVS